MLLRKSIIGYRYFNCFCKGGLYRESGVLNSHQLSVDIFEDYR